MDFLAVQYLEYRSGLAEFSPAKVRAKLVDAAARLPITHLLVGWDLPETLLDTCRKEAQRMGASFYRWHPLLTGNGAFYPRPEWRTVSATGETIPGFRSLPEFTFACPNHPEARQAVMQRLEDIAHSGLYQGLFLDRIRFPSPAGGVLRHLGCFCQHCQRAAADQGLDLAAIRQTVKNLVQTPPGCIELVSSLFQPTHLLLEGFMTFRRRTISGFLQEICDLAHAAGMEVGLDCFTPGLTRMVGQDLVDIGTNANWIKVMTYAHTLGPAGLPYELLGLLDWLTQTAGLDERQALAQLSQWTGLDLPSDRAGLVDAGLSSQALQAEVQRGVAASQVPLLAGIELVNVPGVTHLSPEQIRSDLVAVLQSGAAGLALSWDLWEMPMEYLDIVAREIKP